MKRANKGAKKKNEPLPSSLEDATDTTSQFISGALSKTRAMMLTS